jgi:hypothetical protein
MKPRPLRPTYMYVHSPGASVVRSPRCYGFGAVGRGGATGAGPCLTDTGRAGRLAAELPSAAAAAGLVGLVSAGLDPASSGNGGKGAFLSTSVAIETGRGGGFEGGVSPPPSSPSSLPYGSSEAATPSLRAMSLSPCAGPPAVTASEPGDGTGLTAAPAARCFFSKLLLFISSTDVARASSSPSSAGKNQSASAITWQVWGRRRILWVRGSVYERVCVCMCMYVWKACAHV